MSKQPPSCINRNNLIRLEVTKNVNKISKIKNDKQSLRDLVMDLVLHKSLKDKEKHKASSNQHSQTLKKLMIQIPISSNEQTIGLQSNAYKIIEKFIDLEKKNHFKQNNLESLVDQIITFIEQIQSNSLSLEFDLNLDQQQLNQKVINHILYRHFKQKNRLNALKDLDILKSKTIKINQKPQKQAQFQDSPQLSHRFSRDTLSSSYIDKESSTVTKQNRNTKSKLNDLVNDCKVFMHPEKVEKLRSQKIKQLYDGFDIDHIAKNSKNQFSTLIDKNKPGNDTDQMQFLLKWITQIDVSEKLFVKKLENKHKKQKNEGKVGRIMEESEDEEEGQSSESEKQI